VILWLNPVAGLSGDMLLGALLDLGADLAAVNAAVASTGLTGWEIRVGETARQGLRACRAEVVVTDTATSRAAGELLAMVGRAQPPEVAAVAVAAVRALAQVEAHVHGVAVEQVHLHELGGTDTVVDTVGVAAALHDLGVTRVVAAPLHLGAGTTRAAHGVLPVPAPATLALLQGVPVVGIDEPTETVTPTGAALLRAVGAEFGPVPAMTVRATGYGAGGRDTPARPNVLPVVLGSADGPGLEELTVLETTVDDLTGEALGQLVERLLDAGALDAWLTPLLGKKGRPAHGVTALCRDGAAEAVEERLLVETGTLGVRRSRVLRRALERSFSTVTVHGHPVRVKHGPHRAKPEHDDVVAVARATGLPVRVVAEAAVEAVRSGPFAGLPRLRVDEPVPEALDDLRGDR
jgi:uncharacterized protein (TIGR00299 family) protein